MTVNITPRVCIYYVDLWQCQTNFIQEIIFTFYTRLWAFFYFMALHLTFI